MLREDHLGEEHLRYTSYHTMVNILPRVHIRREAKENTRVSGRQHGMY